MKQLQSKISKTQLPRFYHNSVPRGVNCEMLRHNLSKETGAIAGDSGSSALAANNPKWRPHCALL